MSKTRPLGCLITSALTIVVGLILLIIASIYTDQTFYLRNVWNQMYSLSIFSIIIGILAIIFASCLIYVVVRQYPALTALFSGLLIFVAFLAVICGVILITGRSDLGEKSRNRTEQLIRNYSDSDAVVSSKIVLARIQQSFECCGLQGSLEWKPKFHDGTSVPDSCCIKMTRGCGTGALNRPNKIYQRGCLQPVYTHIQDKYDTLIGLNFTVMVFALISAILGIIYERYVREQYQSL